MTISFSRLINNNVNYYQVTIKKKELFYDLLVTYLTDDDDADAGGFGEGTAEAGDEDLETSGIENKRHQTERQVHVLGGDNTVAVFAKEPQDIGHTVRKED